MKLKYLGTAASEGLPALFCECEICKKARELGEKNLRSRTQALINDDLLIDFPPDTFYHLNIHKIDLSKINNVIITHIHEDHFYPYDFDFLMKGYSHPNKCIPFTVNGSIDVVKPLEHVLNSDRNMGLRVNVMEPYKTYKISKYNVTPLRATHGTPNPYIYIINDGVKTMLFCHDSGIPKDEVFDYLKNNKIYFDLISLDCNASNMDIEYPQHMNVERVLKVTNKLKELKIINNSTKVILNHFSHNGVDVLYDDLAKVVAKYGFLISYDGLEIEF